MNVLVIGSNGQIGKQIVEKLALEKGYFVRAMVRKAEQGDTLSKLGGKPVIADLEKDFSYAYDEIDAVVFAAGSGGSGGPEKTTAVDEQGAIRAIETAKQKGVKRFVLISTIFAGEPDKGPDSLAHYLAAKGRADDALIESGLDYTIVRPVALTNDAPTGKVGEVVNNAPTEKISRADVAAFVTEVLPVEKAYQKIYTIESGSTKIEDFWN